MFGREYVVKLWRQDSDFLGSLRFEEACSIDISLFSWDADVPWQSPKMLQIWNQLHLEHAVRRYFVWSIF